MPAWPIAALRVDGGMSVNPTFVQALADATGHAVEVAPVTEATTLGAGFLAGLAVGLWWSRRHRRRPGAPSNTGGAGRPVSTGPRGPDAVDRAAGWIPELSAIDF